MLILKTHGCYFFIKDDEEGDEDDDDEGSEMELDEDFPDINAAPHIRFERFDRDDDLIIEFDNMFSNNGEQDNLLLTFTEAKCICLNMPEFLFFFFFLCH